MMPPIETVVQSLAPALFLSHGAPLLAIEDSAARRYLTEMGGHIRQPRAIVIMSAHHHAQNAPNRVEVVTDPGPATVHDFGGFPDALYAITYPASGAPDLGTEICEQLTEAGFDAAANPDRGFDHGIWVPLMLMYPQADVPVVQIAINMAEDPHWHFRVGAALAPLRESNVLIVGSGSATHNLNAFFKGGYSADAAAPEWVTAFADWLADRAEAGDTDALLHAVERGPHGEMNHPTMDHILPLFLAMGAGGMNEPGKRIHHSISYGVLAMDMYAFGAPDPATIDQPAA